MVTIRPLDKSRDLNQLRACIVELQDDLRKLDPRMPSGKEILDEYVAHIFQRCIDCDGEILVADTGAAIAGYALVYARVVSDEIDEGNLEYGLIADLVVLRQFRGLGIGAELLDAAESCARSRAVKWLRIGVLANNELAWQLYRSRGFENQYVELEKKLEERRDGT